MLLAPHHGSPRSRPADIMRWTSPEVVVISAGAGLPINSSESTHGGGDALVLWTHRDGMIEVVTDGRQLRTASWRGRR